MIRQLMALENFTLFRFFKFLNYYKVQLQPV